MAGIYIHIPFCRKACHYCNFHFSTTLDLVDDVVTAICKEAGLPDGVLNIVHGSGPVAGEAIVRHPDVKAISFTGSTRAGERIATLAAPKFKKLSLELGGKNPTIIFADCNWERMLRSTIDSSFSNQGQICLCGSRILIEESIYEKFRNAFIEKAKNLLSIRKN